MKAEPSRLIPGKFTANLERLLNTRDVITLGGIVAQAQESEVQTLETIESMHALTPHCRVQSRPCYAGLTCPCRTRIRRVMNWRRSGLEKCAQVIES